MTITFENNKECNCYENLVNNETDRAALKRFKKYFNQELLSAALKTHKKLLNADNAEIYNNTSTIDNKIQLKQGIAEKDALILKVRIQRDYRKFFYYIVNEICCLKNKWNGQFKDIRAIHVFEINKHDYNL